MNVKLSLTHFANLAEAIECCLLTDTCGLNIYNVADDRIYVLSDVIIKLLSTLYPTQLVEKYMPLWVLRLMLALRIGDLTPLFLNTISRSLVLDISKIKRELNYSPSMNLDLSLDEIKNWVKAIGGTEVLKTADPHLAWLVNPYPTNQSGNFQTIHP